MTHSMESKVLAGFLAMTLVLFSVPMMPNALADGLTPVAVKDIQKENYVTSDVSPTQTKQENATPPSDPNAAFLEGNTISAASNSQPMTRTFAAKAQTSQEGDTLSVEVRDGAAVVTWRQAWQTQTYQGTFDEASQSIKIENVKYGYTWNVYVEQTGSQYALKRFDVVMNQTGYEYEQRYGFSNQRLSYIEYASKSSNNGSYDSLYRRGFTYNAAGQWMDHTISVNRSTYMAGTNTAGEYYGDGTVTGGTPQTQYSIWTDIGSTDEKGNPVKTSISLYGTEDNLEGIQSLYDDVRAQLESGKVDYAAVGSLLESNPAVFMKTVNHYKSMPPSWNNQLFSVEYLRGDDALFDAKLLRNKNDYQNVFIVTDSSGGDAPEQWKTVLFKNWQNVSLSASDGTLRNYYAAYGMFYQGGDAALSGYNTAAGRAGQSAYGLTLSSWYNDPVKNTWVQDLIVVDNFPENRLVTIGGRLMQVDLSAEGVISLKPAVQKDPDLDALRKKLAAMIEAASGEIAAFEKSSAEKTAKMQEMSAMMNPLVNDEAGLFEKINGFDNIPGMENIKAEALRVHKLAAEGVAGAQWILDMLNGDIKLDGQDIELLRGYVESLKKIAASLENGNTNPGGITLPEHPVLSVRDPIRPSVDFGQVITQLKETIQIEGSLLKKAQIVLAEHEKNVAEASAFAKGLSRNADGSFNLDFNFDGVIDEMDLRTAQMGFDHALLFIDFIPQDTAAFMDLNGDGRVNRDDIAVLVIIILNALDKEAPVISDLKYPALSNQLKASILYSVDGVGKEKIVELASEGKNVFVISESDEAGNVAEVTVTIVRDTIAPEILIKSEIPQVTNADTLKIIYSVDGQEMEKTFQLAAGKNELRLEARDEAGNVSAKSFIVVMDNQAPVIRILSDIPALTNQSHLVIEYVIDAYMDGTNIQKLKKEFDLTEGHNALSIEAQDAAGNIGVYKFEVTLDTVAPVIANVEHVSLTNQLSAIVKYTVDGIAKETKVELGEEGENHFVLTETDEAGNVSKAEVMIVRDTIAPEILIKSEIPQITNADTLKIVYSADGKEMEKTFQLAAGKNELRLEARDEAGNVSTKSFVVVMDNQAPVIRILSDIPALTNQKHLVVKYLVDGNAATADGSQILVKEFDLTEGKNGLSIEAKDAAGNVGIYKFEVTLDTVAPVIANVEHVSLTNQLSAIVKYTVDGIAKETKVELGEEGENHFVLTETDEAGNVSKAEAMIVRDTIAPEILIKSEIPQVTNADTLKIVYSVDGQEMEKTFQLAAGKNELRLEARDEAGNISEKSFIVVMDNQAPVIRILSDIPALTNQGHLVIEYVVDAYMGNGDGEKMRKEFDLSEGVNKLVIEAQDTAGNIGVYKFEVTLDTAAPVIANVEHVSLTNQLSAIVKYTVDGIAKETKVELGEEGENHFVLTETDEAGNVSKAEVMIVRDTIAPEILIKSEIPQVTNADTLKIIYSVDGQEMEKTFQLTAGKNELRLEARDEAGNVSAKSFIVVMDNQAPVIRILSDIPALTNQGHLVIEYVVDAYMGNGDGEKMRKEFDLSEGVNKLVIEAQDAAGNIGVYKFEVTLDTVPPVIADVEHVSLTNQLNAIVKYTVDGAAKEVKFELGVEGENHFLLTATDEAGNASKSEVVIVRDTIAPKIVITSDIPQETNSSTLTLHYTLDGGNEMEKTIYLVEGSNKVFIEHTDDAGNTGRSEVYEVTYKIDAPQNHKPVANGASFKVNQNGELEGFVTGSDEDGDVLSYALASQPKHGTLEINAETGAFIYKPAADFNGADEFSFTVHDGTEISDASVISIEITLPGSAPVFDAIPDQSVLPKESLSAAVSLQLHAVDPDGGAVTYSIKEILKDGKKMNMPERMLLTADGKFSWPPEPAHAGRYVITFEALDLEGFKTERQMSLDVQTPEICVGNNEVCNFLRQQYNLGLAAGNVGDYYDNRDGGHTNYNVAGLPQLSRMNTGWAATYSVYPDRVIIGNSSTSGGQAGTSNPGSLESSYGATATYNQYRANALYMYPEHIDHDAVDNYFSNNGYVLTSQGSSGSEMDEVNKYLVTLAAFRPEVKAKLKEKGLLMPTMEMIFRLTRVGGDEEKYMTGEAHPRAFDNSSNLMAMVRMANAMTLEDIPAFAQIKVEEEDFVTGGNFDNKTEKQYDTPSAVSRVFRSLDYTKTMIVDAGESFDVNGQALAFEWRVLRGDEDHVRITPLNDSGSRVKIEVDYQNEAQAAGSQLGSSILSNRVDVGLFVDNGHSVSAPAFISVSTLRDENRTYDENGVLKEITYNANAMSSQLGFAKGWAQDIFNENGGWTRVMSDGKSVQFTSEGYQVMSLDALGRTLTAQAVTYAYNSSTRKIGFTASGSVAQYEYAGDSDKKGRIAFIDFTDRDGTTYRGRLIYDAGGRMTGVSVETPKGDPLSFLAFELGGGVFLSSSEGSSALKVGGNRTLSELIQLAGSSSAVIHILFKTAEILAAEAGAATADYELGNMSFNPPPAEASYEGYLGNLSMMFHNIRSNKDSWAYSWTQRLYPKEIYPDYPSEQGFHIATATPEWTYVFHDFTSEGVLMGTHDQNYETKMKVRNLTVSQFVSDYGYNADDYEFTVSFSGRNGDTAMNGEGGGGYRIEVRAKDGTLAAAYQVALLSFYTSGGTGNAGLGSKYGTVYQIYDESKPDDLWGYILENGVYILAWESHQGVKTCHRADICS